MLVLSLSTFKSQKSDLGPKAPPTGWQQYPHFVCLTLTPAPSFCLSDSVFVVTYECPCQVCACVFVCMCVCLCLCLCVYCTIPSCSWLEVDLFAQVTIWKQAQQHPVRLKRGPQCHCPHLQLLHTQTRTSAHLGWLLFYCRMLAEVGGDAGDENKESWLCCCFPAWQDDSSWRTWWDGLHCKVNFFFITAYTVQLILIWLHPHCCTIHVSVI